jgi:hypothetical protein
MDMQRTCNPLVRWLLRSPLLLTFTGWKSGREQQPVV